MIALENIERFPVDLNSADLETLLRTPGVGPISADRIMRHRREHKIDNWKDLMTMGVVRKKAWPFVIFPGHKPEQGRQLRMELLGHEEPRRSLDLSDVKAEAVKSAGMKRPIAIGTSAECGDRTSCTGCPLYGAPGHPGSRERELVPA